MPILKYSKEGPYPGNYIHDTVIHNINQKAVDEVT